MSDLPGIEFDVRWTELPNGRWVVSLRRHGVVIWADTVPFIYRLSP